MCGNTLLVCVIVFFLSDFSRGQTDDYTFIEAQNSFYKIHTKPQTWSDAKLQCALEGASLFYPENEDEQNAVMLFRNTTQPNIKWIFLGISDLTTEGVFETIDGKALSQVYSNWKRNEPNDVNGEEDCVEQDKAGRMNDVKCSKKQSFICKKSLSSPELNNSCNKGGQKHIQNMRKDYTYVQAVNSFYKIHVTPQNWSDAKLECAQEGASLFYPENEAEQNAVMSFQNITKPDVKWVFVGISDLMTEGVFETIDGKVLSQVYSNWKSNEPNDANGDEDCVEQDNAGKMNDVKCSQKFSFICKQGLSTPERNNSCYKDGQKDKQFIRKDYTYIEAVNSFYKIHTTPQNWSEAKLQCAQEGASLFYPENLDEQNAVMSFQKTTTNIIWVFVGISDLSNEGIFETIDGTWSDAKLDCALEGASLFYPENENEQNAVMWFRNATHPDVKNVFVGISDLMTDGVFETIDGNLISEVYNNWKSGEPNDDNGEEDCVEQDNAGEMSVRKCSEKLYFICKKSLLPTKRNNITDIDGQKDKQFIRKDYTYIEAVNSFYKIHTTPQNWSEAKLQCAQEGASLFYPENLDEQNAVMSFQKTTTNIIWVFVGISDLSNEGIFETIDGKPLSEVYSNWKLNEPNDANGEEDCVEQDNTGKMNDVKCSQQFSFICKKILPPPERNNTSSNIDGQKDKVVFRKDYTYIGAVNSFYKFHTKQTWSDAKLDCALEGASLFYPENENEQNAVMWFRNATHPDVKNVFVGISDLMTDGVFETIDGNLISEVYNNWKSGEPNDDNGEEDCVEQDNAGEMSVRKCSEKLYFICKKSLLPTKRNNSTDIDGQKDKQFIRKDYTYIEAVNSFYKIHATPQNWSQAKLQCAQEGASLFYPENLDEQNAVMSFQKTTTNIIWVFVGISDLSHGGIFETIDGKPLSEVYSNWKLNEPNDANGEEDCVEQDNTGKMNDVKCSQQFSFICKKILPPPERNNTSSNIDGQKDKVVFRKDYTYIGAVNSFYKFHTKQTWSDAKLDCALEGASLFYPENENEQNAVMWFRNATHPDVKNVFVGISDLMTDGVFETIDGNLISEVYNNWKSGEPNDDNGEEDCVEQDNAGEMSVRKCSEKLYFICKKSLLPTKRNNSTDIDGQKDKQLIRKDYTYIEAVNSFYKIHATPQNWSQAKLQYAQEGASLFYPENLDEQNAVMSFQKTTTNIIWVFVGISDLSHEGIFETIDGKPLSEVYSNWKLNEPNDANGEEDCVEQDNTGKMNDVKCSQQFSFICKKRLPSPELTNNTSNKDGQEDKVDFRKDYTYIEAVNSFYKIHTTPQNWFDAKLECAQEGASLFYPENEDEQNAVISFRNTTQPNMRWVFVGISDLSTEGAFESIDGKPISAVYSNWKSNEPNDADGEEDCVEQDNTGKMNDVKCSQKFSFICKRRLPSPEPNSNRNIDKRKDKLFFRMDYTYIESENRFYKIHTKPQNWSDAKLQCALEGASLFYSENDDEQNAVMAFQNTTQPDIKRMFVGISDLTSEGVFETIDGRLVSEVYNKWRPGEPNYDTDENCVEQDNTGEMNDCKCSEKLSFICKKSLPALQQNNSCNVDYYFDNNTFKCYKLHSIPLTWAESYVVCRAEQAHLAVINNQLDANYLAKLTETASKEIVGGNHQLCRGIYHLGFRYKFKEGWQTVRGTPFNVDDGLWWNNNQPIIDENEQCGSMFYTGRLNSVDCDTISFFICEQELDSSYLSEEMFQ